MSKRRKRTVDDDLLSYWNARALSNIGNGCFDEPVEETADTYSFFLEKAHETAGESNARVDHMEFMRSQGYQLPSHTNSASREVVKAFEKAATRILEWEREDKDPDGVMPVERLTTVTNARARLVRFMQTQRGTSLKPKA